MISSTLNRASRSDRARRVVEGAPLTRRVVDRFVAGEREGDAVSATRTLRDQGRWVTIDVLGEDVVDVRGAEATMNMYLSLITGLHAADLANGTDLSLKLSALGQALPRQGAMVALRHAEEICAAATSVGCTVTLDMEDHTTVDSTLAIGHELRTRFPQVGNVLQSNLRRTAGDIAELGTSGARVRLVKGAYREPQHVAFQRKVEVDFAYLADLEALMGSSCYPMVATHDPTMLQHARRLAADSSRSVDQWEAQMLFGVRTDLQAEAVAVGERLRVYVPFGTDWYGYFMRRLAERPANVAFFLRALAQR